MKKIRYALVLLAAALWPAAHAAAQRPAPCPSGIINISTGVDNAGNVQPAGTVDAHWSNNQGMNTVTTPNSGWSTLTGSAWIGNSSTAAAGDFTYTISFSTPSAGSMSFTALADNYVQLYLDNNLAPIAQTPGLNIYGFTSSYATTYSGALAAGSHTLTAVVHNEGGPAGFNLSGTASYTQAPQVMDLSTGVANNTLLAQGVTDPNWSGPNNTVTSLSAWQSLGSGSQWIGNSSGANVGTYNYTRVFSIPAGGTLNLQALADNNVKMYLDNTLITQTSNPTSSIYGFQLSHVASYSGAVAAGTHTLKAVVYNEGGPEGLNVLASVSYCGTATPPAACSADPGYTASWGGGNTINFVSTHSAQPNTNVYHTWDFGDGNTSNAVNPSHAYAGPGTYNVLHVVHVQVLNSKGEVIDECIKEKVCRLVINERGEKVRFNLFCYDDQPDPTCHVDASYYATYGGGTTADFHSNNVVYANTYVQHSWDFGDGNTSTAANPSHTYAGSGSYTVTHGVLVQVLDADGNVLNRCREVKECRLVVNVKETGVAALQLYCEKAAPQPCIGDATYAAVYAGGLTAEFTSNNIYYANTIVSHSWDFDDGTTSTDDNPVHTFPADGDYKVTHKVATDVLNEDGKVIDHCDYEKACLVSIYARSASFKVTCVDAKKQSPAAIRTDFVLAPNPARNELILHSNGESYELQVISLDGRVAIQAQTMNGTDNRIDISGLPSGSYIAVIRLGEAMKHIRFAKVQ